MYSVAFRKRINDSDHFWHHKSYTFIECKIDTKGGRYWYADPFLLEKNGIVYIFFEAFDLIRQKGKVAYCTLNDNGTCSIPHMIIDEKYHLSFPYIFEYKDDMYIMPEMSGDYSLKLYKSSSFPDEWEISDVLLSDVYACDSIFIEKNNVQYLLTNEMFHNVPNGQYASCWVKNFVYKKDNVKVSQTGTRVAEGDFGIRNAGKSFIKDGVLYRIGQDCREKLYGRGLVLFEIVSVDPYSEKKLWNITCDDLDSHIIRSGNSKLLGVHTYNFSEHYEIIDFSEIRLLNTRVCICRGFYIIYKFSRKVAEKLAGMFS